MTPGDTPPPPSPLVVWEHISQDKPFEDLTAILHPDLHQWAIDTWQEFVLRYIDIETAVGALYREVIDVTGPGPERGVFLDAVKLRPQAGMWRHVMLLFDGRDNDLAEAIWQALRPQDSSR